MTRKLIITFAALAVAALALAACGSDDGTTSTDTAAATTEHDRRDHRPQTGGGAGAGGTIKIAADPGGQLAYTTGDLETEAGDGDDRVRQPGLGQPRRADRGQLRRPTSAAPT